MSARKRKMKTKALELIEFRWRPTFREMMTEYRFWMRFRNRVTEKIVISKS